MKAICTICGRDCKNNTGLASHMKSAHPDQWVPKTKDAQDNLSRKAVKRAVASGALSPETGELITPKPKRTYKKRIAARRNPIAVSGNHQTLGFCPVCGLNINHLAAALNTLRS